MRKLFQKVATALAVAVMLAGFILPGVPAALAQETLTITFAGQPLTGPSDEMAGFILEALRPAVAEAPLEQTVDTSQLSPIALSKDCFGVVEKQANGFTKLLETNFMTEIANDRFNAVVPGVGEHGDWPPHLVDFEFQSSQAIGCDELASVISWLVMYKPDQPGMLTFSFMLDAKHLEKEYSVMASQGDLGLFIASPTPTTLTVNGETFESSGCFDCVAFTAAVTNTIGAGVYSPSTVDWFGTVVEDAPELVGMYVLPVEKKAGQLYNVSIQIDAEEFENDAQPVVALWFGRFDMP